MATKNDIRKITRVWTTEKAPDRWSAGGGTVSVAVLIRAPQKYESRMGA